MRKNKKQMLKGRNSMRKRDVCWNITDRCNENCQFCYRILCNRENTYEQNKIILKALIDLNVEKISWTGGESLLYTHLFELMKEAHNYGIKNNIITNGRNLNGKIIKDIEEYTDYITFSLDSLDDNVNNELGRGIEHAEHIIKLLDYIKENKINIKVKLNSIVTKYNIGYIKGITNIINKYDFERWKLFKFIALRGKSLENAEKFEITEAEYDNLILELKTLNLQCPIVECKREELEHEYLLINAIGEFLVTTNGKDKLICDYKNIDLNKLGEIF